MAMRKPMKLSSTTKRWYFLFSLSVRTRQGRLHIFTPSLAFRMLRREASQNGASESVAAITVTTDQSSSNVMQKRISDREIRRRAPPKISKELAMAASAGGVYGTLLGMFTSIDTNGNGFIGTTDLQRILSCFGVAATRNEVEELLEEVIVVSANRETRRKKREERRQRRELEKKEEGLRKVAAGEPILTSSSSSSSSSSTSSSDTDNEEKALEPKVSPHRQSVNIAARADVRSPSSPSPMGTMAQRSHDRRQRRLSNADPHGLMDIIDGEAPARRPDRRHLMASEESLTVGAALLKAHPVGSANVAPARHSSVVMQNLQKEKEREGKKGEADVDFETLVKVFHMWQSAAGFRMFEGTKGVSAEHIEDAKRSRFRLFPMDGPRVFLWHVVVLGFTICAAIAILGLHGYQDNELCGYLAVMTVPEVFFSLILVVDVYVQLSTVIMHHAKNGVLLFIDTRWGVFVKLVRFWFWVDLIAAIPFRFIFSAGGTPWHVQSGQVTNSTDGGADIIFDGSGCLGCTSLDDFRTAMLWSRILSHLHLVKLLRFATWFEESSLTTSIKTQYIRYYMVAGSVMLSTAQLIILVIVMSWLFLVLAIDSSLSLSHSTYNVMTLLTTVGFGDIRPHTDLQRLFFMGVFVVTMLFNAIVIGNFVEFFQAADIDSKHQSSVMELSALLDYFFVPEALQQEVFSYFTHVSQFDILSTYGDLFVGLPEELQKGLELWTRLRVIQTLPYIHNLHNSAKLHLADVLLRETYLPEEFIIHFGEIGEEMFFLNHGFVDVYSPTQQYLASLRFGTYFGEGAILAAEPQRRGASVKAISYCEVFVLRKEDFADLLRRYPKMRSELELVVKERVQRYNGSGGGGKGNSVAVVDERSLVDEVREGVGVLIDGLSGAVDMAMAIGANVRSKMRIAKSVLDTVTTIVITRGPKGDDVTPTIDPAELEIDPVIGSEFVIGHHGSESTLFLFAGVFEAFGNAMGNFVHWDDARADLELRTVESEQYQLQRKNAIKEARQQRAVLAEDAVVSDVIEFHQANDMQSDIVGNSGNSPTTTATAASAPLRVSLQRHRFRSGSVSHKFSRVSLPELSSSIVSKESMGKQNFAPPRRLQLNTLPLTMSTIVSKVKKQQEISPVAGDSRRTEFSTQYTAGGTDNSEERDFFEGLSREELMEYFVALKQEADDTRELLSQVLGDQK